MKSFSQTNRLLNGLVFLLIGCVINTSVAQQSSSKNELWKGVIIDPDNKLVYTINPRGGIDGVEITTGKKIWHSDQADRPIIIQGAKIIAQRDSTQPGVISLVSINNKTGAMDDSRTVSVNNNVLARVNDGLNQHFEIVSASLNHLEWQFRKESIRGIAPENNTINLDNTISNANTSNKLILGEISFNNSNRLADATARELTQIPATANITIEGNFLSNKKGRQFKSLSGNHIIVSNLKSDPTLWEKYQWDIYDLAGQKLGSINNPNSYISFNVVEDIILFIKLPNTKYIQNIQHEELLSLQAYSLITGQRMWQHEIKDLTYKGPYPQ
jgi:hypothetical protein